MGLNPFERGLRLAGMVMAGTPVTSNRIRRIFGVSRATAKRDMTMLAKHLPASVWLQPNGDGSVTERVIGRKGDGPRVRVHVSVKGIQ